MPKLLLLDADVVMDYVTRVVFEDARYYKKDGIKHKIEIENLAIIEDIDPEILKSVQREAREARLGVDPGESTSIAYPF